MPSDESFEPWLTQLRAGDTHAAQLIFQRHVSRLVGLARGKLEGPMRRKVDAEDVVQSAFRTFFRRISDGQFTFDKWDDLWTILAVITLRKCGHQVEYYRAACRDVRKEVGPAMSSDESARSWQGLAREPTPSEALVLTETVEQVLANLNELEQKILLLRLEGFSTSEIAAQVQRTDRTVRLVLEKVRKRLEAMRDA